MRELAHLVEQAGLEIPQFNRRRAMRALEIAHFGRDLENQETLYQPLIICLDDERSQLYERIQPPSGLDVWGWALDEAKWLFDHYPDVQAAKGNWLQGNSFLISVESKPWRKLVRVSNGLLVVLPSVSWPGSVIACRSPFIRLESLVCRSVFLAR